MNEIKSMKIKALAVQLEEIDEGINLIHEDHATQSVGVGGREDHDLWDEHDDLLKIRKKVRSELYDLGVTNVSFGISRGMYGPDHYKAHNSSWDPSNGSK